MPDKKTDRILLKISQESYYINRVLESCSTIEQLQNTENWINQIIHYWDIMITENISEKVYIEKYKDIIDSICDTFRNSLKTKVDFINQIKDCKKEIVIKGFK